MRKTRAALCLGAAVDLVESGEEGGALRLVEPFHQIVVKSALGLGLDVAQTLGLLGRIEELAAPVARIRRAAEISLAL